MPFFPQLFIFALIKLRLLLIDAMHASINAGRESDLILPLVCRAVLLLLVLYCLPPVARLFAVLCCPCSMLRRAFLTSLACSIYSSTIFVCLVLPLPCEVCALLTASGVCCFCHLCLVWCVCVLFSRSTVRRTGRSPSRVPAAAALLS